MTDQEILTQMQNHLIEEANGGTSISSGLWTTQEWIDAINNAQLWIVRESACLLERLTLNTVPGQHRHPLPEDWIQTVRVGWEPANGVWKSLARASSWDADHGDLTWTYELALTPQEYTDFDPPTLQLQVMPASFNAGVIHLLYVGQPTELSNTGVEWSIPDMLVPAAKWEAMAYLLAKEGRGQDLIRAQGAHAKALEGLEAIKVWMGGWR